MTWNHRVIKSKDRYSDDWYAIHEVFYDDNGKPHSYTLEPIDVSGESVEDLRHILTQMIACLEKPILTEDNFKNDTIRLELTCGACPEQYDAFIDDKQVGYLRLRHRHFSVDCPNVGGETVYEAEPKGDGIFDDDERDFYLEQAKKAIMVWYKKDKILLDKAGK